MVSFSAFMFPVLFTIGNLTVSSFGFFALLAFFFGLFFVWRLARAWEMDEEKILDLIVLTFLGGLIGARLYFVTLNLNFFASDLLKIFLITKYPGFSFWGGFLGGWLSLYFFSRKFKMNFWQIADIASIGFFVGLIFTDLGCFLGGCSVGAPSKAFFAVDMVGVVGKRFPVQLIEGLLLLFVCRKLWAKAIRFHAQGKIISLALIYLGLVKFFTAFFRPLQIENYIFSLALIILGIAIFYQQVLPSGRPRAVQAQRTFRSDVKTTTLFIGSLITSRENRSLLLSTLGRNWYNQKTAFKWKLAGINKFLRRIRVKFDR